MTIEAQAGEWVGDYFKRVKEYLQDSSSRYETVRFNDVFVTVSRDSNVDDLLTIYDLNREVNRLKENK
jgi:hypothetical protein